MFLAYNFLVIFTYFSHLVNNSEKYPFRSDYTNYLTGAHILQAGEAYKLYDIEANKQHQKELISPVENKKILPYRSLPIVALIFLPFIYLNFLSGYYILFFINLSLIPVLIYLSKYSGILPIAFVRPNLYFKQKNN